MCCIGRAFNHFDLQLLEHFEHVYDLDINVSEFSLFEFIFQILCVISRTFCDLENLFV